MQKLYSFTCRYCQFSNGLRLTETLHLLRQILFGTTLRCERRIFQIHFLWTWTIPYSSETARVTESVLLLGLSKFELSLKCFLDRRGVWIETWSIPWGIARSDFFGITNLWILVAACQFVSFMRRKYCANLCGVDLRYRCLAWTLTAQAVVFSTANMIFKQITPWNLE